MDCKNCVWNDYHKAGVPYCMLPRCDKPTPVMMARLRELSGTSDRGAEWRMIVQEIRRRNGG